MQLKGRSLYIGKLVKAMRKKLLHKSCCVVMNTLVLMEALMKNCSTEFQLAMADPKVVGTMVKLIKAAKRGGVDERKKKDKCLELVQSWGEAFLTRQQVGRIFVDTYHELRKKGKVGLLVKHPSYKEEF